MNGGKTISGKVDSLLEEKEGELIAAAVARAVKLYQSDPSQTNFRDLESAKKVYTEFKKRSIKTELTFGNPTAVHNYLVNMGYKMGKSKLNSKLANNLKSMPRKDGVWIQSQIDRYAAGNFEKMNGINDTAISDLDQKIKQAELRKREGDAEKIERENAKTLGQLIDRSKVKRDLVARMIQLRKDEKTDNKVNASPIIVLVGGDIEKEKELQKYLNDATDRRMNTYAKPFKFSVSMSELEKEIALLEAEDI